MSGLRVVIRSMVCVMKTGYRQTKVVFSLSVDDELLADRRGPPWLGSQRQDGLKAVQHFMTSSYLHF